MKTVLIMRHAKSSWDYKSLSDFQRPLNSRGERDAPLMAKKIKSYGIIPSYALISDAERTRQTAEALITEFPTLKCEFTSELYLADAETLTRAAKNCPDQYNNVLILAHNPGVTDVVYHLTRINLNNIPTSGVCAISFDIESFADIKKGEGEVEYFIFPKMI